MAADLLVDDGAFVCSNIFSAVFSATIFAALFTFCVAVGFTSGRSGGVASPADVAVFVAGVAPGEFWHWQMLRYPVMVARILFRCPVRAVTSPGLTPLPPLC